MLSRVLVVFILLSTVSVFAKAKKISPFQINIQSCFGKKLESLAIETNQQLFKAIEKAYPLTSSELKFREVAFKIKNQRRKLKFDGTVISIHSLDDEDQVKLLSTENVNEKPENYELRYKSMSPESRIGKHLLRADIDSDYSIIKENRTADLSLELIRSEGEIKSLKVVFLPSKKTLDCSRKTDSDICYCRK